MGSGIAEVCARAGADVIVCETDAKTASAGLVRIEDSLARAVRAKKIDEVERDAVLASCCVHDRHRRVSATVSL